MFHHVKKERARLRAKKARESLVEKENRKKSTGSEICSAEYLSQKLNVHRRNRILLTVHGYFIYHHEI